MKRSLGTELATAARKYKGKPAINHAAIVPGCSRWPETRDECLAFGLGQFDSYDCSGLVLRALSDVLNLNLNMKWVRDLRHVRQQIGAVYANEDISLHNLAYAKQAGMIGALQYTYRKHGPDWYIGHVNIISEFTENDPIVIQAQAGFEGMVVERPPIVVHDGVPESLIIDPADFGQLILNTLI